MNKTVKTFTQISQEIKGCVPDQPDAKQEPQMKELDFCNAKVVTVGGVHMPITPKIMSR